MQRMRRRTSERTGVGTTTCTGHWRATTAAPAAHPRPDTTSLSWRERTENQCRQRPAGDGTQLQGAAGNTAVRRRRRGVRGEDISRRVVEMAPKRHGGNTRATETDPIRCASSSQAMGTAPKSR